MLSVLPIIDFCSRTKSTEGGRTTNKTLQESLRAFAVCLFVCLAYS
jgi:hypothetical protein